MIWIAIGVLVGLEAGFVVGWLLRGVMAQPVCTPMPVRITPPRLAPRLIRVINRISSPELAQWN